MKRKLYPAFVLFFFISSLHAQTPDWSTKVASIVYGNCSVCHHTGAIAPFPLMSYTDAVDNGFNMQSQVNAKKMPPWPADPNYRHYWDEKVLSDDDISAINSWVDNGMPSGDLSLAPAAPVFNGGAVMTDPDDVFKLPVYTIPTDSDEYRSFVVHSNYTEPMYINQIDFVPGDPSTVHHAVFLFDTSEISWNKEITDTIPGYETGGFDSPSLYSETWGGWNPGRGLSYLPPNMAWEILPGADYVFDIHYAPGNAGKIDSSKLLLKYCTVPDSEIRRVYQQRYLIQNPPSLVDGPLKILANQVKSFHEQSIILNEKSCLGIAAHSHQVCVSWKVYMLDVFGDTTNILYIPHWNFNWQYSYLFTQVMKIPNGAQFFGEAVFDNTSNNPDNPNNPPQNVSAGPTSADEMMNCRFWLMNYEEGDENIILDSAFYGLPTGIAEISNALSLKINPNPAADVIHFTADLKEHQISWTLYNLYGSVVKSSNQKGIANGIYFQTIDVSKLSAGTYLLSVQSGDQMVTEKIEIQ